MPFTFVPALSLALTACLLEVLLRIFGHDFVTIATSFVGRGGGVHSSRLALSMAFPIDIL